VLAKLPGWVIDDDASVREEVAEWKGLSPAERWKLAHLCARDAIWAARISGDLQRILDYVDPLPESTVTALERLRRARKAERGDT
jgi:uncharacterized damage-inducible protein DinB